jgi:aarF domain-containing kinase
MYIGFDYKLNFKEGRDINALHERSSERLYTLLIKNKGLYIKMGQAIAIQSGIFPPSFQGKFSQLFDSAPQDSWHDIENLFKEEFGVPADEFFDYIDHRAHASASVSQVYKARLKTGEWVAVKLQHCDLKKQVAWDLAAYRWLMYVYDRYLFKFPIYFIAEHVSKLLEEEVNFRNEVQNSERLRKFVENDGSLRNEVYIPKVYLDMCTDRIIVSEWIDGVTLNNRPGLRAEKYNTTNAVDVLTRLFAKQIFEWGTVHCDPHPGNIILRRVNNRQQLVLIDHGLFIQEDERFRRQYSQLWRGMFLLDTQEVMRVAGEWGFGDAEMFASATMMQAYKGAVEGESIDLPAMDQEKEEFKRQEGMRDRFQNFMRDTTKIPLELIFLGRTIRILQGCNRMFGSPINRVKIFAFAASRSASVGDDLSWRGRLRGWKDHFVFWFVVTLSDLAFVAIRVKQLVTRENVQVEDVFDDHLKEVLDEVV